VFVIVGAAVAIALVNVLVHRQVLRAGSSVQSGPPVRITDVPTTYTATYRVENRAGGKLTVTTEKYWVRRPFDSRIETWRGSTRLSVRYSRFAAFASESSAAQPLNIAVPPGLASGDLRIDAVVDGAVRDKIVVRRERRRVYGRSCQVYRAGGPVSAGDVTPYKPGSGEYADVCVDRHGLVLEEVWTSKNKVIRRRAVTALAVGVPIDDDEFAIRVKSSDASLQGSVKRVSPPGPIWSLKGAPAGFRLLGTFAVRVPSIALPQSPGGAPAPGVSSTSQIYVRGPDLLIVDQDPSLTRYIAMDDRLARPASVPPLRDGEVVFDARMSEARGATADGSAVRIFGTLPPSQLIQLARGIVRT
jgi:hypothetical protein